MKNKKHHTKDLIPKKKDQMGDKMHRPKPKTQKVKYRHMSHWLAEEDDDIEIDLFGLKDEEE